MAIKGGKVDGSGEKINSVRLVTDADANAGLGDVLDPIRVDPTGTTVQPVSFSAPQHVIVDSGGGSNASVGTTGSAVPASATLVGATKSGNLTALALDASGNLNVAVQAGGGGGTQYADGTTQATPTGTVALGRNPSNVVHPLALDASGNLNATIATALPAGTAVIGHVIVDSGAVTATLNAETTKVLGVTRTADGSGNLLTSTTNALDVNIKSGAIPTGGNVIGHVIVDSGAVAATLAAETTKVIGVVRTADGAGNLLTSTGNAIDVNLKTVVGTIATSDLANGPVAAGAAASKSELQGSVFNTTAPAPTNGQQVATQCDAKGNLLVSGEGRKATYRASVGGFTALASGISVAIFGSASTTVKITKITVTHLIAAAASARLVLNKYSAAPTGGTSTSVVITPMNAANAAATGTVKQYSVAPTAGALVGVVETQSYIIPQSTTPSTAGNVARSEFRFGDMPGTQPITLSGTAQGVGLLFSAAETTDFTIEFTEE